MGRSGPAWQCCLGSAAAVDSQFNSPERGGRGGRHGVGARRQQSQEGGRKEGRKMQAVIFVLLPLPHCLKNLVVELLSPLSSFPSFSLRTMVMKVGLVAWGGRQLAEEEERGVRANFTAPFLRCSHLDLPFILFCLAPGYFLPWQYCLPSLKPTCNKVFYTRLLM